MLRRGQLLCHLTKHSSAHCTVYHIATSPCWGRRHEISTQQSFFASFSRLQKDVYVLDEEVEGTLVSMQIMFPLLVMSLELYKKFLPKDTVKVTSAPLRPEVLRWQRPWSCSVFMSL